MTIVCGLNAEFFGVNVISSDPGDHVNVPFSDGSVEKARSALANRMSMPLDLEIAGLQRTDCNYLAGKSLWHIKDNRYLPDGVSGGPINECIGIGFDQDGKIMSGWIILDIVVLSGQHRHFRCRNGVTMQCD